MPVQEAVRVFGAKQGQPGVRVIERAGANALSAPKFGCTQMTGLMKRAPMGVMLPFTSKSAYQELSVILVIQTGTYSRTALT
ncbi:MAG: hypothetical protein HC781_22335 [Leptolyngbyaceae cyanobacterium CSU_1_4]|nr:hypothetical protein [Leptolyngbyaceae cyanobacterium CSU_1_4]